MSKGKRILIITYYWPPSGGAGVQRWLKFVKALSKKGWEPVIYTPENPEYPSIDESMLAEVPEGIELLKTPIWEPFELYKRFSSKNKKEKINAGFLSEDGQKNKWTQNLSIWIRGNFFIPDARKFWIKPSVKYLKNYLSENPVDYIITTGPPHSMHLIGLGLKKRFAKIPWVADFRDPWTNIDFYKDLKLTKLADKKHHKQERAVLTKADAVITIGNTMKLEFDELGGNNVHVITNGFDEADLPKEHPGKDPKFSIAHIGTLNASRNPQILWEALDGLFKNRPELKERIEIKLVGKVDVSVKNEIKAHGLEACLNLIPYLKHEEAIKEQMKSHLLLLMINNTPNAKGILTGKMFEYISSGSYIMGIGPKDGDAALVLAESKSGEMFGYEDKEDIQRFLEKQLESNEPYKPGNISAYSRTALTDKLIELLEGLN